MALQALFVRLWAGRPAFTGWAEVCVEGKRHVAACLGLFGAKCVPTGGLAAAKCTVNGSPCAVVGG